MYVCENIQVYSFSHVNTYIDTLMYTLTSFERYTYVQAFDMYALSHVCVYVHVQPAEAAHNAHRMPKITCMHACMCTYTYIHIHINIRKHGHTRIYTHRCWTAPHACTCQYTCANIFTCIYIQPRMQKPEPPLMNIHVYTYAQSHVHVHIRATRAKSWAASHAYTYQIRVCQVTYMYIYTVRRAKSWAAPRAWPHTSDHASRLRMNSPAICVYVMYVCMFVCMHVCMYVCMYVCYVCRQANMDGCVTLLSLTLMPARDTYSS